MSIQLMEELKIKQNILLFCIIILHLATVDFQKIGLMAKICHNLWVTIYVMGYYTCVKTTLQNPG